MTALTITYVITTLLYMTILAVFVLTIIRLKKQLREIEEELDRRITAKFSSKAKYNVHRTFDGEATMVERAVDVDGYRYTTLIKIFNEPDQDYNLREAEDLAKHLNER